MIETRDIFGIDGQRMAIGVSNSRNAMVPSEVIEKERISVVVGKERGRNLMLRPAKLAVAGA